MADFTTVLHLSDLHLGLSEPTSCLTPNANCHDYIGRLYELLQSYGYAKVDIIIATGDFVDQGSNEQFKTASQVLSSIAERFATDKTHIVTCCGNHDYDRVDNAAGAFRDARFYYVKFAKQFAAPTKHIVENVCTTYLLKPFPFHIVALDTTWGNPSNKPGRIPPSKVDHLGGVREIADTIIKARAEAPVFVLSHYPFLDLPAGPKLPSNYRDLHIAVEYFDIITKVAHMGGRHRVFCFYGDVHQPVRWQSDGRGICHFASARLDSPTSLKSHWNVQHGVRLLRVMNDGSKVETFRCDFEDTETGEMNPTYGQWNVKRIERWAKNQKDWTEERQVARKRYWLSRAGVRQGQGGAMTKSSAEALKTEESDSQLRQLSDMVIEEIRERGLVRDCRVRSREGYVRLAHVLLGPIMNESSLMTSILSQCSKLLPSMLGANQTSKDTCLVGLDSWGSWMAAEIGLRSGTRNIGMSARGLSLDEMCEDLMRRGILNRVGAHRFRSFIIVTDVVVTWDTVLRVREALIRLLGLANETQMSLICLLEAKTCAGTLNIGRTMFRRRISVVKEFPIPVLAEDAVPIDGRKATLTVPFL